MVSMDPPLKKRRLLESTSDTSNAPHQELISPKLPLSEEEIMKKRRNRDEIRKVHDCYKRIRFYIGQKNSHVNPDFELTYLSLIDSSNGCTSVRRIIAELIPRYAVFCPSVIESAARILVNMHNLSMSVVQKGDDSDGVAYHTSKACIFGLVDICSSASSEASTSSITKDICSSVFSITFDFFISTLEGEDTYMIKSEEIEMVQKPLDLFRELRLEEEDGDTPMLVKLSRVLLLCVVKILFSCPRDLLGACFDFISSNATDEGKCKKGFFFLNQVTTGINKIQEKQAFDLHDKEERSMIDVRMDNEVSDAHERLPPQSTCLLEMVICKEPSLREWMLTKSRELSRLLPSEASAELSQFLMQVSGFSSEVFQHLDSNKDSNRDNDTSLGDHSLLPTQNDEHRKPSSQTSKPEVFSQKTQISGESSSSIAKSGTRAKEESSDISMKKSCDGSEDKRKTKQNLGMDVKPTGMESGQTTWYFDGDQSSMDVYPASNQIWISSLGRDASDTVVRLQFEDFGPVNHFYFFGAHDFALIEYRNIMDAVRAREFMGGSSPWGSPLRVKFMDTGLGSKGFFHGTAIGKSSHVYVRKIPNHRIKDELIQGLISSGLNGPRAVTEIVSESALMLEFLNAEQAALAMDHIRKTRRDGRLRKDNDGSFSQLIVRNIDPPISEEELIRAFSMYGEIVRYKFNQQNGLCSIDFRSFEASDLAKSRLNGARFGTKKISIESSASNSALLASTSNVSNVPNSSVNEYIISELSALSSSICSRYGINESSIVSRTPCSDENQVASNTLHVSFTDVVSPSLDEELKDFCNLAAGNAGSVVRLTRSNAQKSFWFVEFDRLDGAVVALNNIQNCPGVFFHVKFGNDSSKGKRNSTGHLPPTSNTSKESQTINGNEVSQGKEQNRQHDKHDKEHHQPSCLPFVHPAWDAHAKNPLLAHNACVTVPFIPPSVTPLSQISGTSLSSTSPSLPPPPPPLAPPPPPPPPPNSPPPSQLHAASEVLSSKSRDVSTSFAWQGSLCKSGALYCSVHAKRENSEKCKYSNGYSEPADWPSKLDVTQRTAFRNVASTFSSAQPRKREVCRLSPSTSSDVKGLRDFAGYLKQKECAGVIKLPAVGSMWARVLFILPNSSKACSMLGIIHDTSDCLLALVLPKDTGVDS